MACKTRCIFCMWSLGLPCLNAVVGQQLLGLTRVRMQTSSRDRAGSSFDLSGLPPPALLCMFNLDSTASALCVLRLRDCDPGVVHNLNHDSSRYFFSDCGATGKRI